MAGLADGRPSISLRFADDPLFNPIMPQQRDSERREQSGLSVGGLKISGIAWLLLT